MRHGSIGGIALYGMTLCCFILGSNLAQAGPGGFFSKIRQKTPEPAASACSSAQLQYSLISSKLGSEMPFCAQYLAIKSHNEDSQSAKNLLADVWSKNPDPNPADEPYYNYIQNFLTQLIDTTATKMTIEKPTCQPHLDNILNFQKELKEAKKQVCQACNFSPDDTDCEHD